MSDQDRFNHFPASPLVSVTSVIAGTLQMIPQNGDLDNARALPAQSVMPPQQTPTTSWSAGPVAALTIGFYPDAWATFGYDVTIGALPDEIAKALDAVAVHPDPERAWLALCDALSPIWNRARRKGSLSGWATSGTLKDWSRAVFVRAALAGPGRSTRAIERRLRRWSGHTRQTLDFYAKVEGLHQKSVQLPEVPLAELATEMGYSDQSHMGRAVRRVTGFSPADLNRRIETEEGFWCYRLLGERF